MNPKEKKVIIYVVYHDDRSYKICHDILHEYSWIRFFKIESTKFCESIIFDHFYTHKEEWKSFDFVGMITYSFNDKIKLELLVTIVENIHCGCFLPNIDLIGLRGLNFHIGDISQQGIEECLEMIMQEVPLTSFLPSGNSFPISKYLLDPNQKSITKSRTVSEARLSKKRHPKVSHLEKSQVSQPEYNIPCVTDLRIEIPKMKAFYSNYWIMRNSLLDAYLTWIQPIKKRIEKDQRLIEKLHEDSNYKDHSHKLIPIFERPWMTWHPFVMERMICIYAHYARIPTHVFKSKLKIRNNRRRF